MRHMRIPLSALGERHVPRQRLMSIASEDAEDLGIAPAVTQFDCFPQPPLVSHSQSAQDSCRCGVSRVARRCEAIEPESVKRKLHQLHADCGGNTSSPVPGVDGVADLALAPTPAADLQFAESDDTHLVCDGGPYVPVLRVVIPSRDRVGDEPLRVLDGVGSPGLVSAGFFGRSPLVD